MLEPKQFLANGQLACAILNHIRIPVFLVDANASVLLSNDAAKSALTVGDQFKQIDNFLFAMQQADNARLRTAISSACATGQRQTFMINEARESPSNIVTVVAFEDDETTEKRAAMVFMQKCEPSEEAFTGALRQMFRLSAAETTIAAALVSGVDVEHIAEMRNAKITTVRTQIAAMLLKTRTRRQGELVALLSRICTLP